MELWCFNNAAWMKAYFFMCLVTNIRVVNLMACVPSFVLITPPCSWRQANSQKVSPNICAETMRILLPWTTDLQSCNKCKYFRQLFSENKITTQISVLRCTASIIITVSTIQLRLQIWFFFRLNIFYQGHLMFECKCIFFPKIFFVFEYQCMHLLFENWVHPQI